MEYKYEASYYRVPKPRKARLGKHIYNERGHILLCEGLTLTQRMINRLVSLNIPFVYIQDSRTDDIIAMLPVSGKLRREAINTIETTLWT